jgi:hypothetical protein
MGLIGVTGQKIMYSCPPTKLAQLRRYMRARDYRSALRLAASWPRLGEQTVTIRQGWAAMVHPRFYEQIGRDPDLMVQQGIAAIRERYRIG